MKKFFGEFKKFITRGNVLDMAVGVIVGGAFTAIVNGLSNFVLRPVINWLLSIILGKGSLENIVTYLGNPVYKTDANGAQVIDLANSFYIDWGAFINAVINFFLIAIVLFTIVKFINRVKEGNQKLQENIAKGKLSKEDKKALKEKGVKLGDKKAVKEYLEEKQARIAAEEEQAKRLKEEKAQLDRLNNPTTEDLLKQIKEILEKQTAK